MWGGEKKINKIFKKIKKKKKNNKSGLAYISRDDLGVISIIQREQKLIYLAPPHKQDVTQGQFLSGV